MKLILETSKDIRRFLLNAYIKDGWEIQGDLKVFDERTLKILKIDDDSYVFLHRDWETRVLKHFNLEGMVKYLFQYKERFSEVVEFNNKRYLEGSLTQIYEDKNNIFDELTLKARENKTNYNVEDI
jgi:hypothetical protein